MMVGSVNYQYRCTVVKWLDGDTVDLSIDLGFNLFMNMRCRLFGLNCPEVHSKDKSEKKRGLAAKAFSESLAPVGSVVSVESHKSGAEKFGRWLATVTNDSGKAVNAELIKAHHAMAWDGQGGKPI
jgi:micrococcal nuclease